MSAKRQPDHAPCNITPRDISALLVIEFQTVEEAAQEHHYSPRTIRQWCDEGRFECYKWSGRWMIVKIEIAKFCRKRRD